MKRIIVFGWVIIILSGLFASDNFNSNRLSDLNSYYNISHRVLPNISQLEFTHSDIYVGPSAETLFITSDTSITDNIIILGDGVLIIDEATLDLSGQLYAQDNGKIFMYAGSYLLFNQFFVGQYSLWLLDSAFFQAEDATIDANGVMHFAELHHNSTFIARRTYFPDWNFRRIYDHSTLILEDITNVGDFMVNDSCNIHLIRCDTLMPWFQMPDGSVADIQFPDPEFVEHFELSYDMEGVDGIGYSFVADSCHTCWWSLETFPDCSVIIRDSQIHGSCIRIPSYSDTFSVYGITNYGFYLDLLVPLTDRHLQYQNTYVYWWNWYPMGNTVFYIDSCRFGELIGKDSSFTFATRCFHDGATITLVAKDNAFLSFESGSSYAYVSTFQNGTMVLKDVYISPHWSYQTINIAHHNSRMFCINCEFDTLPFALDTALVMWASIDSILSSIIDGITIFGSAFIDVGPYSTISFAGYALEWSFADEEEWNSITESTEQVRRGILGVWYPPVENSYRIKLTIWTDYGDTIEAVKEFTVYDIAECQYIQSFAVEIYPNPFNSLCVIEILSSQNGKKKYIDIFDYNGKIVDRFELQPGVNKFAYNADKLESGIYYIQIKQGAYPIVRKVVLIK
ncbi:hypothetical protein DRQ33_04815 [bacterium]|nr:MAG: hypothetical protein DRQ33_04815 [bacterium]